jgi:hypothetical protein
MLMFAFVGLEAGGISSSSAATDVSAPLVIPAFSGLSAGDPPPPWTFVGLVHQTKPKTEFHVVQESGVGNVMRITADHSYGNLAVFGTETPTESTTFSWSWKLVKPNPLADLTVRSGDDTPVKVCVLFNYPLDALSFSEHTELSLVRAQSETPVPTATVCYVWDHALPVGRMLPSPFTKRLTYFIVETGEEHVNQWEHEQRKVLDDFQKAYGTEYAKLGSHDPPAIIGVLVGADADNTATSSEAEVGDLKLSR